MKICEQHGNQTMILSQCPFCRIAELKAKVERDRERLDTAGNTISRLTDKVERLRHLLQGTYDMLMAEGYCHRAQRPFMNEVAEALEEK